MFRTNPFTALAGQTGSAGVFPRTDASGASAGQIKPCPDEETFFDAVGWKYKAPEERR